MFDNIPVHPIRFSGVYNTADEVPYTREEYGDHRDDGTPIVNGATQKMIDVVKSIDKPKLTVVDFGGGNGKMYSTLKQETDKFFDYKIIDLPGLNNDLGEEVTYYTSIDQITGPVDILFTDATVYLTEDPAIDNIKNFCSLGADYIVLNRTLLFFHQKTDSDLTVKSFYTWVPQQKNIYNLVEVEEYEKCFQSSGYEMACKTFTGRIDETPPRQIFRLVERGLKDPVITYYDHIFEKSE